MSLKRIIIFLLFIAWTFVSTQYFMKSDVKSSFFTYFPSFILGGFLFESLIIYLFCKVKHNCKKTNHFKIGILASLFILNIIMYSLITSLHVNLMLYSSLFVYILSFIIFNPISIYFSLYRFFKCCFKLK